MVSWNEKLFAAIGSHDELCSFGSIYIIHKNYII